MAEADGLLVRSGGRGVDRHALVSLNGSVFPGNFDLTLLITIYAMMILGGLGSQAGAVLGAILITVLLELLREPSNSRYIFYAVLVLGLVAVLRVSVRLALVAGGVILLGVLIRVVVDLVDPSWTGSAPDGSGWLGDLMARWVVEPDSVAPWLKSTAYISLIALALLLTTLRGWTRLAVLVPVLYLATFVWENVLAVQPEVTRYILLGALLVVVMIVRPKAFSARRGRDRLVAADVLLELRSVTMTFGGLTVVEASTSMSTRARSSA